jgi:hypothetical protein
MIKKIWNLTVASILALLPDYAVVNLQYFRIFRRFPNLRAPQTLTEKLIWRKLYQRDPRFTVFSDKVMVKPEIAKIAGPTCIIETMWSGQDPAHIPFGHLEPPYVIKVNHACGGHIFIHQRKDIDRGAIIKVLRKQLGSSFARRYREWGYVNIPRQVLVERMLKMPDGGMPEDCKFFVYHGPVHFIEVTLNRFTREELHYYDRDWNLLPVELAWASRISPAVPKPETLSAMMDIAEKIGEQFDFVRVDLYSVAGVIMFGEVAFYPGAGMVKFEPRAWDTIFGAPWRIAP